MKNNRILFIISITLLITSFGCGTLVGGRKYVGSIIVVNHSHASISVDGKQIGVGTAIESFPRKKPLSVLVKQEGCEAETKVFNNSFRTGSLIFSASLFGYAGIAVDLYTGASFKPDHKRDSAIQKISRKNYVFLIDYKSCPSDSEIEKLNLQEGGE
ncbi:MAG: hypothetical protein HWD62_02090 [Cyclobacteriaceae bacterium]|nr:hypothetical protein [Bacteroidetes bacterium CHB5]QLH31385.1 MAG: hypothetical protein HWD62_02090 [Cyclobacteriaceae bacterium]